MSSTPGRTAGVTHWEGHKIVISRMYLALHVRDLPDISLTFDRTSLACISLFFEPRGCFAGMHCNMQRASSLTSRLSLSDREPSYPITSVSCIRTTYFAVRPMVRAIETVSRRRIYIYDINISFLFVGRVLSLLLFL